MLGGYVFVRYIYIFIAFLLVANSSLPNNSILGMLLVMGHVKGILFMSE